MSVRILTGDCRAILPTLEAGSVQCVVTSPPYWGLRDYGMTDQIGLECTPEEYVVNLVAVFREVRRVLRADGTVWLNLGDCYATGAGRVGECPGGGEQGERWNRHHMPQTPDRKNPRANISRTQPNRMPLPGLKPKDLVGIPWRVAFALQADGWWLRSDIVWAKPNPMPESIEDRPTKAHEFLFLLTKAERYFYDAGAIAEQSASGEGTQAGYAGYSARALAMGRQPSGNEKPGMSALNRATRNRRSVWTIPTDPYPEAHFATFPPALVQPCILAGTSAKGCCPQCGAPWERVTEVVGYERQRWAPGKDQYHTKAKGQHGITSSFTTGTVAQKTTVRWEPTCACYPKPGEAPECFDPLAVPCTVLDPFAGTGTVGEVATALGRHSVLIELNPSYVALAERRNAQMGLFA